MQQLHWVQKGNEYTTTLLHSKAIITEHRDTVDDQPIGGALSYTVRIEDGAGNILGAFWDKFRDFERAEAWAMVTAVELDQAEDDVATRNRLVQILEMCETLLPTATHPAHYSRLERIKQWVTNRSHQNHKISNPLQRDQTVHHLDWIEIGNDYHAHTPHGTAIITEIQARKQYLFGTTISYQARIEHSTGAALESLDSFIDFVDAERWVYTTLSKLDDPHIAKVYIENIRFTLSICQHVLPADADPIHYARLDYLKERITEHLF